MTVPPPSPLARWLRRHLVMTFFLMMLFGLVLGLASYNLFFLVKQNANLVIDYGWMALMDGALIQLFYLFLYGVISLVGVVGFKICEKILVDWLLH